MKIKEKNLLWINKELESWIGRTDKYKKISDLPLKGFKVKYKRLNELRKWKEDLYFIKDGEEIIISGGALLWLFLYGNNDDEYVPEDYMIKRYPRNVLEEFKMFHRLNLFGFKPSDFDKEKIKEVVYKGGLAE
jgi:hypothetical protein